MPIRCARQFTEFCWRGELAALAALHRLSLRARARKPVRRHRPRRPRSQPAHRNRRQRRRPRRLRRRSRQQAAQSQPAQAAPASAETAQRDRQLDRFGGEGVPRRAERLSAGACGLGAGEFRLRRGPDAEVQLRSARAIRRCREEFDHIVDAVNTLEMDALRQRQRLHAAGRAVAGGCGREHYDARRIPT